MVASESRSWHSTNNIAVSYFKLTCGIGLTFDSTLEPYSENTRQIILDATAHFDRYWNSEYTFEFDFDKADVD